MTLTIKSEQVMEGKRSDQLGGWPKSASSLSLRRRISRESASPEPIGGHTHVRNRVIHTVSARRIALVSSAIASRIPSKGKRYIAEREREKSCKVMLWPFCQLNGWRKGLWWVGREAGKVESVPVCNIVYRVATLPFPVNPGGTQTFALVGRRLWERSQVRRPESKSS